MQEAISLAHAGAYSEARATVIALLHEHPEEPDAWFWLACVTESPWEALSSLKKVQELAARYPAPIASGIDWVQETINAGQALTPMSAPFVPAATARTGQPPATSAPWRRWALGGLAIVLLAILAIGGSWLLKTERGAPVLGAALLPTAEPESEEGEESSEPAIETWMTAWEKGDWANALAQLQPLSAADPADATWRNRLVDAHLNLGLELLGKGEAEAALAELDAGMALNPYHSELHRYRALAASYVAGMAQYRAEDWDSAIRTLRAVVDAYPDHIEGQKGLYDLHYALGMAYQSAGNLDEAEAEYQIASHLTDDVTEISERFREVAQLRIPEKRIEISIAEQRLVAYEDDEVKYDFVISTGMYSSPTQAGSFEILDKMPMAYGSTWDLDMPFWMGIYWSGTLENGIHALPILSNGQLLWEGLLGQPASYGCIILGTEDAETLYNWAEIGTPVLIY